MLTLINNNDRRVNILLAVGPWLIEAMFGASYAFTAALLPWTLMLVAPYFWAHTLSSLIVAHGRYHTVMLNNALGALVFTGSFPWLVQRFDLYGAVAALALGLTATVLARVAVLRRHHALFFYGIIGRAASAVAVGISLTFLALPLSPWLALLIGYAALLGFSVLIGVVSDKEIRLLVDFAYSKRRS